MSRIHEALKKAEEERAASQPSRKPDGPAEPPAPPSAVKIVVESEPVAVPVASTAVPVAPQISAPAVLTLSTTPSLLRFEQLCAQCVESAWHPDPKVQLFSNPDPFAPGTEQFRTLRSRLYRIRESQPLHIILISSALPAEGKTIVSANLAQALTRQAGCKVLLIDADLRAPRQRDLLGAPAGPGLADYLQGGATESQVMQKERGSDLFFIQAGEHITHPAELISNGRLKQLFERVAGLFDWVIVDSPPILPVSDATVIARLCDGVLLVVRAGVTPAEISKKACQELGKSHIVGVVLNSVEKTSVSDSYYQYGYGQKTPEKPRK